MARTGRPSNELRDKRRRRREALAGMIDGEQAENEEVMLQHAQEFLRTLPAPPTPTETLPTLLEYLHAAWEKATQCADDAQNQGSFQAAVAARRLAVELRRELEAERARAARDAEQASGDPDSLIEDLRQIIADLPLEALGELEAAIKIRRGLRVVQ